MTPSRFAGFVVVLLLSISSVRADGLDEARAAYEQRDYTRAVTLLRPLADGGNAAAQHALATCYHRGRGVEQDEAEAARLYAMAARQGYALAQNNLGMMYQRGTGVPRDYALALA